MHRKKNDFQYTFELLPARASKGRALDELLLFAEQASDQGLLNALSITDNAGGHPALSPLALGREISAMGMKPVIHFSCKDKNRNTLESQLLELDRAGLHNLMVITGDYPGKGFRGRAKPVFDLDSVQVLDLVKTMNRMFVTGCVVSPFKFTEAEQVGQYLKLAKKIKAGAKFIVSQMGFDLRKFQELLIVRDLFHADIPLYATVFVPDLELARLIYRGVIPGCTMPRRLLERMESEASEHVERTDVIRLKRAAKLIAVLRGIGFEGVHLSGYKLSYANVKCIIGMSDELFHDWRKYTNEFLFPEEWSWMMFEKDPDTGLNLTWQGEDFEKQLAKLPGKTISVKGGIIFAINNTVHNLFFEHGKGLYGLCKKGAEQIAPSSLLHTVTSFENLIKGILYDCRHCGDCYLDDNGFLCPQSQCAKFLVNGPCGGSKNGWCEVWPGKKRCVYVRIYERAKQIGSIKTLTGKIMPPRDWSLNATSSWLNFYLDRDHSSKAQDLGSKKG